MAGVKGRSGGAREGAGAKPDLEGKIRKLEEAIVKIKDGDPEMVGEVDAAETPLQFLKNIWNNPKLPLRERMRAAITAAQYEHIKKGRAGKKEEAREAGKSAAEDSDHLRPGVAPPRMKRVA